MATNKQESERKAFKDWFDRKAAKQLAAQVQTVYPTFDNAKFVRVATRNLNALEMQARVNQFVDAFAQTLPAHPPEALGILRESLPPLLPDCESVTDGWLQWPVGHFIAAHGLDHIDDAFETMIELTQRFSSEFAVRPFVQHHPKETFKRLGALTDHPSAHVRRWCSEGTRPRLPWGVKLHELVADPKPIWPILEALKDDESLYVRRSVANNINDIAKDHPEQVVDRTQKWSKKSTPDRDWLIKHSLRSLLKDGNADALAVIGYGPPKKLSATLQASPKTISIGDKVALDATITNGATQSQQLMVDYVVHYVRKGNKTSGKVFKWKTLTLGAKETTALKKQHAMKVTTIRALYPGAHKIELQVNGARVAETTFNLK